jgi:hypothetical protein
MLTLDDYRQHVEALLRAHAITATWTTARVRGASAFANSAARHITCPPMIDDDTVATALHEIGHCVSEPCAGPRHYRDPDVTDWWNCLACEVSAWTAAIRLIRPLPWSRAMHHKLTRALQSYRRRTPGHVATVRELDVLASHVTYYDHWLGRVKHELLLERHDHVKRNLDLEQKRETTMRADEFAPEEFADIRRTRPASVLAARRRPRHVDTPTECNARLDREIALARAEVTLRKERKTWG